MKYTTSKLEELRHEAELNLQHATGDSFANFEIEIDFDTNEITMVASWFKRGESLKLGSKIPRARMSYAGIVQCEIALMLSKVEASV